jgi:hypothetical protein
MKTSKLLSLSIFLGIVILMNLLSIPVQAQTLPMDDAAKQPTHTQSAGQPTKKTKNTPPPKRTNTPRPANTATRSQHTSLPTLAFTSISQSTQTLTTGTSVSTKNATLSTVVTSQFSATPTALGMGTIAAQQTATVNASFLTSTAVAKRYSPTPTNFGAASPTPGELELTATSAALTTTPTKDIAQFAVVSPTSTFIVVSAPILPDPVARSGSRVYWFLGAGILLLVLSYLVYREWKKPSPGTEAK